MRVSVGCADVGPSVASIGEVVTILAAARATVRCFTHRVARSNGTAEGYTCVLPGVWFYLSVSLVYACWCRVGQMEAEVSGSTGEVHTVLAVALATESCLNTRNVHSNRTALRYNAVLLEVNDSL